MKIQRRVVTLVALALAIGLAGPAAAQRAEWNQERITKLAKEVKEATDKLYTAFYKRPVSTVGSGQANSTFRLKQTLRRLKSEASHFANALEGGMGRDESYPIYENLAILLRNAQEDARKMFVQDELLEYGTTAEDRMRQIAPYYETKDRTPEDPESSGDDG